MFFVCKDEHFQLEINNTIQDKGKYRVTNKRKLQKKKRIHVLFTLAVREKLT